MIKVLGLGLLGGAGLYLYTTTTKKSSTSQNISTRVKKYIYLSSEESQFLENDETLDEMIERLLPFFRFDEELCIEIARAAAGAAEFLSRCSEIEHKRSIPKRFREFTSLMSSRSREFRREIRNKMPSLLEEYDELKTDIETFEKDSHHNMWCDAHP